LGKQLSKTDFRIKLKEKLFEKALNERLENKQTVNIFYKEFEVILEEIERTKEY